jgi:hypothetical protein
MKMIDEGLQEASDPTADSDDGIPRSQTGPATSASDPIDSGDHLNPAA